MNARRNASDIKFSDVQFGVQRSARYHSDMRRFYGLIRDYILFINVVFSSYAIFSLIAEGPFAAIAMLLVAILSATSLVFRVSEMAMLHQTLYEDFVRLDKEMTRCSADSVNAAHNFQTKRLEIEIKEPPYRRVLNSMKHNDLCRSIGRNDYLLRIRWYQRLFSRFMDIAPDRIDYVKRPSS